MPIRSRPVSSRAGRSSVALRVVIARARKSICVSTVPWDMSRYESKTPRGGQMSSRGSESDSFLISKHTLRVCKAAQREESAK